MSREKIELLGVIDEYGRGLTPLVVPLTLFQHYVRMFDIGYDRDQVCPNPPPQELILRNHV